jgi:hypothetical protein
MTSYTPTSVADVGSSYRVNVYATNAGGTSVAAPSALYPLASPAPPTNVVLPTVAGSTVVGSALGVPGTPGVSPGTWTGILITYSYQWNRCNTLGASCGPITGATSNAYTLVPADAGSTIRVAVSANNPGGGASVMSNSTALITTTAGSSPSSGGGSTPPSSGSTPTGGSTPSGGATPTAGGGGGGVPPEVALSMSYGPQPQNVGDQFVYAVALYNNSIQGSDKTVLTVNLPAGVEYLGAHVNRGPGCSAAGQVLTCNLDWFPGKFGDTVTISVKVTQKADLTATASVWSTPADSNPANDTASATVKVGASTSTGASSTGASTPLGPDTIVPKAGALPSSAQSGTTAKLHFTIYDDRGIADARVTVKQGTKTIASLRSGFGPVAYGLSYYMPWRVPKSLHGAVTFCVTAVDKSSNSSKPSCSKLNVK